MTLPVCPVCVCVCVFVCRVIGVWWVGSRDYNTSRMLTIVGERERSNSCTAKNDGVETKTEVAVCMNVLTACMNGVDRRHVVKSESA